MPCNLVLILSYTNRPMALYGYIPHDLPGVIVPIVLVA